VKKTKTNSITKLEKVSHRNTKIQISKHLKTLIISQTLTLLLMKVQDTTQTLLILLIKTKRI